MTGMRSKVYFLSAHHKESEEVLARKTWQVTEPLVNLSSLDSSTFVALKIHFGERDNYGFIPPVWIKTLTNFLSSRTKRLFWTDTNTLYTGPRCNAPEHLRLAAQHGFTQEKTGIPVVIADGLVGRDKYEIELQLPHIRAVSYTHLTLPTKA